MIEGVWSDQEGRDAASIQWITGERGALPAELHAQLWFEKFDSQDSNSRVKKIQVLHLVSLRCQKAILSLPSVVPNVYRTQISLSSTPHFHRSRSPARQ